MLSRSNTNNHKRNRSAVLSSIGNVSQNNNHNNHNKRIKLEPNHQNILSANCKRTNVALSSITNVHLNNNKRTKLELNQNILGTNCERITKVAPNTSELQSLGSCLSAQSSLPRVLHLNHLPFDCLSSILSRIPLQHRITRLCLVCHQWKSTVDEMCQLKGQLTINLFSSYKPVIMQLITSDLEHYRQNVRHDKMETLLLKPMNGKSNFLPDLSVRFPLVTQLVIRSNDTTKQQNRASLQLFLSLLRQPKWSLASLTLIKMSIITDPTFLPQICSLINHKFAKQSNPLTQLNLYIQAFGPETGECHPELVTLHKLLPQLERFFVICPFMNWGSVVRTLGDPTAGCKVKELDLCENRLSMESLSRLLSLTMFTSTVTHLHLTFVSSREWFSLICESFGLLQFLQIYIGYNKFDADWFKELSKLAHLTELKMHRFQLDPTVKAVPLPTIKKLTICDSDLLTHFRASTSTNSNRFNADHFCRLLSHHFPSVSVLILLSNEKMRLTKVERDIRKWAQVHFKQIDKVVLVLKAVEYRNHSREQDKFRRQYDKSLRN